MLECLSLPLCRDPDRIPGSWFLLGPALAVVDFWEGILEHIHLAHLSKVLSGDEDFLQASQAMFMPREGDAQPSLNPMKRLGNVFDHVVDRLDRLESKMAELQGQPSTAQLLASSQGTGQPVQDLWQLIKLRKIVEGNEEVLNKSMKTLQDLLTDICALKATTETLRKDVDMLKNMFGEFPPESLGFLLEDLSAQNQKMSLLWRELISVQHKISTIPKREDMVLWSSLHEAMFTPKTAAALQLELSDTWDIPDDLLGSGPVQPEHLEAARHDLVPQPGQDPMLLQTTSQYEAPELLPEQESDYQVPLSSVLGPDQSQVPRSGPAPGTWPLPPGWFLPSGGGPRADTLPALASGLFQSRPVPLELLQPPPSQLSRAPPPATELGSAWPRPVQPYHPSQLEAHQLPTIRERQGEFPAHYVTDSEGETHKKKAVKKVPPKVPPSPTQPARTTAAFAAAAAAAYAAAAAKAARSAARGVRDIRDVKDVPATKLAAAASATAAAGPFHAYADVLGAGSSRGATGSLAFSDDSEELEDSEMVSPLYQAETALLQAMQAMSPDDKRRAVKKSLGHIAQVSVRHDSLKEEFSRLSSELQQRLMYLAKMSDTSKLGSAMNTLQEKVSSLQKSRLKEKELEQIWGHQIEDIKSHYLVLGSTVDKLQFRLDDFKTLQAQVKMLDLNKVNKSTMEQELKEKADRSALASKASRADLETVVMELNEMIQGVLLRVVSQEEDWKKSVEQLRKDMATKFIHVVACIRASFLIPKRNGKSSTRVCTCMFIAAVRSSCYDMSQPENMTSERGHTQGAHCLRSY
ncbi:uncharacterized protein C16orf96 homolog isoform X5 [Ochotona princeps]|uniref:uncharacterized protein C16orf96 homolog isoform X5 n=1 Tax=Ochotona princeps TaxID=9978 RepID=UPI002714B1CC|nr:uncharacterized protein C16orf96 homolog isoform X5 [Ochotona princeps]